MRVTIARPRVYDVWSSGEEKSLFAGSEAGGERPAAFYNLLGTAKPDGLEAQHLSVTVHARRRHPSIEMRRF